MPPQVEKRALISDSATSNTSPAERTRQNNHAASTVTRRPVLRVYAPSMRKVFPFMDLPGELRNNLYEIVIADMGTTVKTHIEFRRCLEFEINHDWRDWIPAIGIRKNLAVYRLTEVSHTIRREFLPMLWNSLHFRACAHSLLHPTPNTGFLPRNCQVFRHMRHLTWESHSDESCRYSCPQSLIRLMMALEFKGTLRCIIHKHIAAPFRNAVIDASEQFRQGIEWNELVVGPAFPERILSDEDHENGEITFSVNFQRPKDDSGAGTASKEAKDG